MNSLEYPGLKKIPGRTLHIDGDFIAYFCTFDESQSFENMCLSAESQVQELRAAAGAEHVCIHLTASASTKGGRHMLAVLKEYQGNRKLQKPKHLEDLRNYLRCRFPSKYWLDQEADDGLCQANWEAIQKGKPELSVIVSKDKDLMQCLGWHMDWDTRTLFEVNGFGTLQYQNGKCTGTGPKFFWAQMLMGDVADNISGLPEVRGWLAHRYKPTNATRKHEKVFRESNIENEIAKAEEAISERRISCGPALAYEILKDVQSNARAFRVVAELYENSAPYYAWDTGVEMDYQTVMVSEAQLLWMRRKRGSLDVLNWWQDSYEY